MSFSCGGFGLRSFVSNPRHWNCRGMSEVELMKLASEICQYNFHELYDMQIKMFNKIFNKLSSINKKQNNLWGKITNLFYKIKIILV